MAANSLTRKEMRKRRRRQRNILRMALIILIALLLFAGIVFAAIMTIPYCFSCSKKISRIKMDNNGTYLKWQKISLIVLGFLDAIILIAYFVVM